MDDFSLTDLIVESATQPLVLGRKYEVVDLDRTNLFGSFISYTADMHLST